MSILAIVALGVAFFSGVRSTEPDLRMTADNYFKRSGLMDLSVVSTMGFSKTDLQLIGDDPKVDTMETGYMADVLGNSGDMELVFRLYSIGSKLNRPELISGRYPETASECLMDAYFAKKYNFKVGDDLKLKRPKGEALRDILKENTLKVVGLASLPSYISFDRDVTDIGSGKVSGFLLLLKDAFSMSDVNRVLLTVKGTASTEAYSATYEDLVRPVKEKISLLAEERSPIRYTEMRSKIEDQLRKGRKDYADGKEKAERELKKAREQLSGGEKALEAGWKELNEKKALLEKGEKELPLKEKELWEGKKKLQEGRLQFLKGKELLAEKKALLASGRVQLLSAKAELLMLKSQYPSDLIRIPEVDEEIRKAEEKLAAAEKTVANGEKAVRGGEAELKANEAKLTAAEAQIREGEKKLKEAKEQLAEAGPKIEEGEKLLREKEEVLKAGKEAYQKSEEETKEKLRKAADELDRGERYLSSITSCRWILQDRENLPGYSELGKNAERIGALGKVFPLIFFLVAALVSLTTMTRMVEEQRGLMGTLKALGYGKWDILKKYVIYAFSATVLASILGVYVGETLFPTVIITAYKTIYPYMSPVLVPKNLPYALMATGLAMICTMAATLQVSYRELRSMPAVLMRPEAPKAGKKVLLEYLPFVWKRLSFVWKSTFRNIFRYKKRLFMTLLGISGCMALIVVGFGLHDSISDIAKIQYSKILRYDAVLQMKNEASESAEERVEGILAKSEDLQTKVRIHMETLSLAYPKDTRELNLIVPENIDEIEALIHFRKRTTGKSFDLRKGALLSEQMADSLHLKKGDSIRLQDGTGQVHKVKIAGVIENYIGHFLYVPRQQYEEVFGKNPDMKSFLLAFTKEGKKNEAAFGKRILTEEGVLGIHYTADDVAMITDMLKTLNIVIVVLIVSAGLLAFVVLYNLNHVNIAERRRELATLKVLGFLDGETAMYVYRENILLTLMSIFFGVFFGILLHRYVISTVEVDMVMFGRVIRPLGFVYSALLTILFSFIVNVVMFFQLRKINMVESLKSVE